MRKMTSTLLVMAGLAIAITTHADTPVIGLIPKQEDIRDHVYSAAEEDIWGSEELLLTNVTIENNSNITAYSPRIRITGTSRIEEGSTFRAGVPVFKVHFINMVDPNNTNTDPPSDVYPGVGIDFTEEPYSGQPGPSMTQEEFEEFCQNEIEILNYYFKSDDGRQLAKFKLKNALLWDDNMKTTNYYKCTSTGSDETDCPQGYSNHLDAFNDTDFDPYRDDNAINIIFFDNPDRQVSGANQNLESNGPPMILIDYQRVDGNLGHDCPVGPNDDCGVNPYNDGHLYVGSLNNGIQDDDHDRRGVEPHEMGHIFGLYHVCRDHPYDPADLWDNVMWGSSLDLNLPGYDTCCEDVVPKPQCQDWYRTSFFSRDPITRDDGAYKYIQSYKGELIYVGGYANYGQAEIIVNMAYHFKRWWSLE